MMNFRTNLFEQLLDNHILEAVKLWLEPLPDGSLPSFDVRKEMLQLLDNVLLLSFLASLSNMHLSSLFKLNIYERVVLEKWLNSISYANGKPLNCGSWRMR
jgi:hypothetical protein